MKTNLKYTLATLTTALALSAASLAQSNPPAWSPTTTYSIGDVVTYEGVEFKCLNNENLLHPNPHSTYWDIAFVYSGPLVIPVGPNETMKTLTAAWSYIAEASIANGSQIEISLDSNYHETFTSSFSLNHPYGNKISIVGKLNGDSVYFGGGGAGFTLDSHHTLLDLEGLTITAPGNGSGHQPAIQISDKACLRKLYNVNIENFDVGISANSGATIDKVSGPINFSGNSVGGVYAGYGATINILNGFGFGPQAATANPPTYGFYAQGGTLNCLNCYVFNCTYDFYATDGGKLYAFATYPHNLNLTGYGYYATGHSYIDAREGEIFGDAYGYYAVDSSYINATDCNTYGTSSAYDFYVRTGGMIDATLSGTSTKNSEGLNDGSYIFGLP